ncbi:MAG: MATE family efflux transporter [Lysobacteraceae bacterium]
MSAVRRALAEIGPLAALAAPLVAGLVASTGVTLVDTAMLGPLGATPLAAVSLTTSVAIIFYAGLYGFAGPVGLFAGRCFGSGELEGIGHIARHGALLATVGGLAGALLMAAGLFVLPYAGQPDEVLAVIGPYWLCLSASMLAFTHAMVVKNLLDAAGRPWLSVAVTVLPALLNVFFNWLLIYGHWGFPRLGLTGAGIASLAAQAIGAAVGWVVVRHLASLREWWGPRRFERAELSRQWNEGRPMTVQLFLEGAAVAVAGVLIGLYGAVALAGNHIALSVGSTLYMLPLGVAGAVTIRIAQVIGAGEWPRVAAIGQAGLIVVTGWMGGFALMFLFAGAWIGGWFVDDPAVIAAAAAIFFVFGFTQLMDGVQSVSLGALRGMLDNDYPTRVSLVAYWLIALPRSVLVGFGFDLGAPGVWAGFGAGLAVAAVALGWRFLRMSRAVGPPSPVDA